MIYHISHIDLDGYGCQIITKKHFKNKKIKFYNCDYGNVIYSIFNEILLDFKSNKYRNNELIITDINLNMDMANFIHQNFILKHNFNVILLDHHITGLEISKKYYWYKLNKNICSTKLTQEYFNVHDLKDFADYVNVQDLWYDKHKNFTKANFIADIAYKGYEFPNIIKEESFKYKIFTIKEVFNRFRKNWSIKKIQKNFIDIQEKFLLSSLDVSYVKNPNISIEHKFVQYIYEKIKNKNHNFIKLNNSKGIVFFELGANIFQQSSQMFLQDFKDSIDFILHINKYGRISIRSLGSSPENNVSFIAKKYFSGGGHFNAAGGSIFNNKYKEISSQDEAINLLINNASNIDNLKLIKINVPTKYLENYLIDNPNYSLYQFDKHMYFLHQENNVYILKNVINNNIFTFDNNTENLSFNDIIVKFEEQLFVAEDK